MDNWLPPVIRDNKYFMYPLLWYWYNGKNVTKLMEFKSYYHKLTFEEYEKIYKELEGKAQDRITDLNQECIDFINQGLLDGGVDSKVLEVGSGRGFFLDKLQKQGFTDLTGVDVLKDFDLPGVKFVHADVERLPFENNEFDNTLCNHTLEHIPDIRKAFEELLRVTKNKLFVTVPCQKYYHYTFDLHIHFFPEQSILISALGLKKGYKSHKLNGDWVLEIDCQIAE
ncbi:MAG: hypothetical protein CL840_14080 [Crocinitomicaceae bacterium]|nr:hypothetical protein [Crocinitomicaceae bacterium]